MSDIFSKYNTRRNELIEKGIDSFKLEELEEIYKEYESIINEWEIELKEEVDNYLFKD